MLHANRRETMRSSRKNRSNSENLSQRRNVDHAKAARAKAAIKAAKSQSPKSVYKKRKFKAAVDLETPKSLLVNIRLKSVINLDTYNLLSREEKERLVLLLPSCDQPKDHSGKPILNSEALNNEFFAKACVEWCERLGEGEFVKDRQQGDASWKVSQNGALNGAKSHVIGNLSTDAKLDRSNRHSALTDSSLLSLTWVDTGSGSRSSIKQFSDGNLDPPLRKGNHRHARNSRLQLLGLDRGASIKSEGSSALPLYGEQLRVGSSRAGHGGDYNSAVTLEKSTNGGVTPHGMSENHKSGTFVHPALRDHDYVWPLQFCAPASSKAGCKSKSSRSSAVSSCYRRKRNRKRVRSKKRLSVGIRRDRASETLDDGFHLPRDLLDGKSGTSLKSDVADVASVKGVSWLNGVEVDCRQEAANSHGVSVENALINNPLVKSNGRLNGTYSPNKREQQSDYVGVQHLANDSAHNCCRLKENDVNWNYAIRPCRLKTALHLRKCEQTDGMPLIQIQSSDLLSRLTSAKDETDICASEPCNKECPSVCVCKTDLKSNTCDDNVAFPALDCQSARTASDADRLSTGLSNSVSLNGQDHAQANVLQVSDLKLKSDDTKFFVKFIGIQKIPFDHQRTDGKDSCRDLIKVDEVDSPLDLNESVLPPSVLQNVRQYINVGGKIPHVGLYRPSGQNKGPLVVERSVENSFHSHSIRSQEDCARQTLLRQTDTQEKHSSSQSIQDFKLNTDLRNHRASCNMRDSSDCVWEAVMPQKEAVHRVH